MQRLLITIFCLLSLQLQAQSGNNTWHGKKCAVVLTYDDAIDQHLDNAVPVLDSLHLKATFYLTAFSSHYSILRITKTKYQSLLCKFLMTFPCFLDCSEVY